MIASPTNNDTVCLTLGWQVTPSGDPRYWLNPAARPGSQSPSELVRVPANTMACHTAICAQSGSGKSYFLGRLIEELLLQTKVACVIFDPNADFRKVHEIEDANLWKQASYDPIQRRGKLPHEASRREFAPYWSQVPIKIVIGTYEEMLLESPYYEQVRLWWPRIDADFLAEDLNPVQRNELYHCHVFVQIIGYLTLTLWPPMNMLDIIDTAEMIYNRGLSEKSKDGFRSAILETFDVYSTLELHIYQAKMMSGGLIPAPIGNLLWRAHFDLESAKNIINSEIDRAVRSIQYVSKDMVQFYFSQACKYKAAGNIITKPPSPSITPINELKRLTVIDLPSLRNKSTRLLVINAVLTEILIIAQSEWDKTLKEPPSKDERVPIFIVLDEAHNLIPAEPSGQPEHALRERFRTIAAEGRKYGIFLIMVSQRPDKLDSMVLSECDNKMLMRLDSETVLNFARKNLGLEHISSTLLEKCLQFEAGRALLVGRWAPEGPQMLYVAARRTREGGRNLIAQNWAVPFKKKLQTYKRSAPPHLAQAFLQYLHALLYEDTYPTTIELDDERRPIKWLLNQLRYCRDIVPEDTCFKLRMPQGATYGQVARKLYRDPWLIARKLSEASRGKRKGNLDP